MRNCVSVVLIVFPSQQAPWGYVYYTHCKFHNKSTHTDNLLVTIYELICRSSYILKEIIYHSNYNYSYSTS